MYIIRKIALCVGLCLFFTAGSCMDCPAPLIPGAVAIVGLLLAVCAVDAEEARR